ncbi:hypothetical protein [Arthrobacter sp. NicSoilB8]|uniref:hypothetical protein n=1 Tax=Arthrobacter sp. NicSoilB8 TaxID=2830998 RepID=UPI001CC71832|nr:hypothetical protein [Arthrobacter sp. NicSoilB8]BCW70731.1 hypothetical protein NicSoilB8_17750 [Arthrobacter sp. NicSoilB8]
MNEPVFVDVVRHVDFVALDNYYSADVFDAETLPVQTDCVRGDAWFGGRNPTERH